MKETRYDLASGSVVIGKGKQRPFRDSPMGCERDRRSRISWSLSSSTCCRMDWYSRSFSRSSSNSLGHTHTTSSIKKEWPCRVDKKIYLYLLSQYSHIFRNFWNESLLSTKAVAVYLRSRECIIYPLGGSIYDQQGELVQYLCLPLIRRWKRG